MFRLCGTDLRRKRQIAMSRHAIDSETPDEGQITGRLRGADHHQSGCVRRAGKHRHEPEVQVGPAN